MSELEGKAEIVRQAIDEILTLRAINADLLEALQKISIKGSTGRELYAVLDEMREIAREAIRKAEGQMR